MRYTRSILLALLVTGSIAAAGCGDSKPLPPDPSVSVGNYTVTITANSITDDDRMYVTVGSSQNVILTFTWGVSAIRGTLVGASQLTLPRQTLHVTHSVGPADGVADGSGNFGLDPSTMMGTVDFTFHLTTPGYGPGDAGGGLGANGPVDYHVVGTKNP